MTLAQSTTAALSVVFKAVNSRNSLAQVNKFDKAIKSFACDSLHDDVNGFILRLIDESGVATKEGEDFGTARTIWNLWIVRNRR